MSVTRQASQPDCNTDDNDLLQVLELLDSKSTRLVRDQNQQRRSVRRQLRAPCEICSMARDGQTILHTQGRTRDISRTGVGIVCDRHLAKETEICLMVRSPDNQLFHLSGVVMHSRSLRGHWYLAGVEFRKIANATLNAAARDIVSNHSRGKITSAKTVATPTPVDHADPPHDQS